MTVYLIAIGIGFVGIVSLVSTLVYRHRKDVRESLAESSRLSREEAIKEDLRSGRGVFSD